MAKVKVVKVTLLDEWDGKTEFNPGDTGREDVTFIVDGIVHMIDLSDKSYAAFKAAMDPWCEKARKEGTWVDPKVLNAFYSRVRKFSREHPIAGTKLAANGKPQKVYLEQYAEKNPEDPNPLGASADNDDADE